MGLKYEPEKRRNEESAVAENKQWGKKALHPPRTLTKGLQSRGADNWVRQGEGKKGR